MRRIRWTSAFKRDFKRAKKGRRGQRIEATLKDAIALLATDSPLPERYQDHPLHGQWSDCRDCHLYPDVVLIYRKPDKQSLDLVRLGSHSQLEI